MTEEDDELAGIAIVELDPSRPRPVLVVTRDDAIPVLTRVIVAPITRTVRHIPIEIALGPDDGLPVDCAASFDNIQAINRHLLTERAGALPPAGRHEICRTLAALADC